MGEGRGEGEGRGGIITLLMLRIWRRNPLHRGLRPSLAASSFELTCTRRSRTHPDIRTVRGLSGT